MKARLRLADPTYFPTWEAFDPSDLSPVSDFGGRIQQVQWAASKENLPPLTGIRITSTYIGATDKFRLAITPCDIPQLVEPVTVPASIFNPLMKSLGEVKIGQDGGELLVMPDESTQIRASIFDGQYPNIMAMFTRTEPNAIMVKKSWLTELIERAMVMGQKDRSPLLKCYIGEEEFAVAMEEREMGLLGDIMDLPGQCNHPRALICFTPANLTSALAAAPNEDITFYYDPSKPMKPVRLDGGSGYEVLIMPRKENSEGE
jgi:DNA polymerase III sliding clamp (beta) subunit (PCNA family)